MTRAPGSRIGLQLEGPYGELFEIAEFKGQGHFGEVYRAIGLASGRQVAVKLLQISALIDASTRTALLNEIELSGKIDHPNIVQVLYTDKGTDPAVGPYQMMEYVSGGTLKDLLDSQRKSRTKLTLEQAKGSMLDIARGAQAINSKLIHRDIKPDNILLGEKGLKITDFGISKIIGVETRTRTFKGIQHVWYMSPEAWENQKNTFKMDVYAAGLVFYEILTLHHPLSAKVADIHDWKAWEKAHRFTDCPDVRTIRQDVSLSLAQLLERMVAKRPSERPGWDEVIQRLESEDSNPSSSSNALTGVVEAALKLHREQQKRDLEKAKLSEELGRKEQAYQYSINRLEKLFDQVVEEFNASYQAGKIVKRGALPNYTYVVPGGQNIKVNFFTSRLTSPEAINGRLLFGGGYIESRGVSANLILFGQEDDDYGDWQATIFRVNAIVNNPLDVIERVGVKMGRFGFNDVQMFYDQVPKALGTGMHNIEEHSSTTDLRQFFIDFLDAALSR